MCTAGTLVPIDATQTRSNFMALACLGLLSLLGSWFSGCHVRLYDVPALSEI
jgi:hypothetical protein